MKRIDFIVAGIISAVWAIITCIYCGQGGTISLDNHIDMGNGWYIPLPSRYWDWLYIGMFYIMIVLCIRGHWVPDRKHKKSEPEENWDSLIVIASFVVSSALLMTLVLTIVHQQHLSLEQISIILIIPCILAYRDKGNFNLSVLVCVMGILNACFCGWGFAFFGTLIVFISKIMIWLVINTFRSGFTTALQQLKLSLVAGQKIVGETGHRNSPPSQERTGKQDATIHFRRESSPQ